jgi:hypothetical protein
VSKRDRSFLSLRTMNQKVQPGSLCKKLAGNASSLNGMAIVKCGEDLSFSAELSAKKFKSEGLPIANQISFDSPILFFPF